MNKLKAKGDVMRVNDWVLVHEETNEEVEAGASVTSFRGEPDVVKGGTPPHKPSSTGRVWVNGGEFFPSVFGLKWVKQESEVM
jgi:hypothetical protein